MPESKRSKLPVIVSAAAALVAVPLLIALGVAVWDDRRFYIVSLLIILVSALPFVFRFERRKPMARELAVLAAMTAIGVAGRAAFYMFPQFKPIAAITVICGVAFGGESGFIVGAMIAFVSNFIFGQGPFTPWQMEGLGLIGLLSGLIFHRKDGRVPNPIVLAVFGGLAAFLIYGPIADASTVFTTQTELKWEFFAAAFHSGLLFNLIHAGATVVFLLILGKPMLKKLNRIQVKYGLLE